MLPKVHSRIVTGIFGNFVFKSNSYKLYNKDTELIIGDN
jgi:hypothetical protein